MGSGPRRLMGGDVSGSVRRRTLANRRGSVRARQAPFDIYRKINTSVDGRGSHFLVMKRTKKIDCYLWHFNHFVDKCNYYGLYKKLTAV